jgi:16S rRNA U1498 N3-methylase RsmE
VDRQSAAKCAPRMLTQHHSTHQLGVLSIQPVYFKHTLAKSFHNSVWQDVIEVAHESLRGSVDRQSAAKCAPNMLTQHHSTHQLGVLSIQPVYFKHTLGKPLQYAV